MNAFDSKLDQVVKAARKAESPAQRRFGRSGPGHLREGYASSTRVVRTPGRVRGSGTVHTEHWSGREDVEHTVAPIALRIADKFGPKARAEFEEMLCDLFGDRARIPAYMR